MFAYQKHIQIAEKARLKPTDKPQYFKANGRPKATSGVFLWTRIDGTAYVLLGEERDLRAYSELSGGLENKANGEAESFVEGAQRECDEESVGLYKLTTDYLLEQGKFYAENGSHRQVMMFIVPAPSYISVDQLNQAQAAAHALHEKEKTDYAWVRLDDLLNLPKEGDRVHLNVFGKGKQIMRIRDFCIEMMRQDEFQKILRTIASDAVPVPVDIPASLMKSQSR